MVRCGGKPEKLADLYFDEVDDVEVDEPWHISAVDAKPAAMPTASFVAACGAFALMLLYAGLVPGVCGDR